MRIYSEKDKITSMEDVKDFFHHIVFEKKINFHPDEPFENYIEISSRKASLTNEECKVYNRLMEESFEICNTSGIDIYQIGLDELMKLSQNYV